MISSELAGIQSIVVHKIGSKSADEDIRLSKGELQVDESINKLLLTYFFTPFKSEEYFNLFHDSDISLNEVYSYVSDIFDDPGKLYDHSINLAKHLYENSAHPKIKSGEFYVVYFHDCIVDGEQVDAVGLFKSESKDTFLKVMPTDDNYEIGSDAGINIHKLDKGCLIFNSEKENGFLVAVVDKVSKGAEAQYWFDHFLHVRQREDMYFQTQSAMKLCKDFVTEKMPEEFKMDKADQAELLNKSAEFFKEKESFDFEEFTTEVMQEPQIIESFKNHRQDYEYDHKVKFEDSFDISAPAVQKSSRFLKSVIKLDKNFHIYVHGSSDRISKGHDDVTGMDYYQLFFEEEK
jgi:hypothetical protein